MCNAAPRSGWCVRANCYSELQPIAFEPHLVSVNALSDHGKSQALIQTKRWIYLEDAQAQSCACLSRFVNHRLYKLSVQALSLRSRSQLNLDQAPIAVVA